MRAYEAEAAAFGLPWDPARTVNALDLADARALARYLCDEFEVAQVTVNRARSNARRDLYWHPYGTRPGRISLLARADALCLCHEVAHHVALHYGRPSGHNAEWATIYLRAVYLTAEHDDYPTVDGGHEDQLRRAFADAGLIPAATTEGATA